MVSYWRMQIFVNTDGLDKRSLRKSTKHTSDLFRVRKLLVLSRHRKPIMIVPTFPMKKWWRFWDLMTMLLILQVYSGMSISSSYYYIYCMNDIISVISRQYLKNSSTQVLFLLCINWTSRYFLQFLFSLLVTGNKPCCSIIIRNFSFATFSRFYITINISVNENTVLLESMCCVFFLHTSQTTLKPH